jgi:hypothetical protein
MKELEIKLKEKTEEFMRTDLRQSHKRTRQYIEMQSLVREIKKTREVRNG